MSDLSDLQKFLDDSYRVSYLDSHVKGGIAYQIQAIRDQARLTQTEFGDLVGMSQGVVSRLEDTEYGAVNINTLLKIANALGIGLEVRFCDFQTVLSADVSPTALKVESIAETVRRLHDDARSAAPVNVVASVGANINLQSVEGNHTWQMKTLPNQPQPQWFRGSETSNFVKYTPMPASLG